MKQSFFASALIFLFIIITSLFATTYKNNINRKWKGTKDLEKSLLLPKLKEEEERKKLEKK